MRGLLNSRAELLRRTMSQVDGVVSYSYQRVSGATRLPCRLDLIYTRPGKDIAAPLVAGKAPDRSGVAVFLPDAPVRAGDRIRMVANDRGVIPVEGTFEIRSIPDAAQDSMGTHHLEVQVWESQQDLNSLWPGDEAL